MNFKCDHCGKPATVHLTEIEGGAKIEKHLCESCAQSEGITIKADVPISQLLENFILQSGSTTPEPTCEICGMTLSEFRRGGLLGCPNDYETFSHVLVNLLERTHEGASQHVGKVPVRAGLDQQRATALLRLRAQLKAAVAQEDYERAAAIRDEIKEMGAS